MSRKRNEKNLYPTSIKIEDDNSSDYYTTSNHLNSSLMTTYKGKIEVTSKGRRKIFDGVRWQILCRRPECRKQTNKKSLCITHYKEEYESTWPIYTYPTLTNQSKIEEQNDTISTTNTFDNDDRIVEGCIKVMSNGQRLILKNNKWFLLCRYDENCRNVVEEDFLCLKHYELNGKKRRKFTNKIKRLKTNDFQISPPSVTEQFEINTDENSSTSIENHSNPTTSPKKQSFDQSVQTDITIPLCCLIEQHNHSLSSICQNSKSTSFNRKSEPDLIPINLSI